MTDPKVRRLAFIDPDSSQTQARVGAVGADLALHLQADPTMLNGARVLWFTGTAGNPLCDHEDKHNVKWKAMMAEGDCVETGTVTCLLVSDPDVVLLVRWDCGELKSYSLVLGEWEQLRVLHLAATGYLGSSVYCDVCQGAMFGFAFRCESDNCAPPTDAGVLYDLCFKHYHAGRHFPDHPFQCYLPSVESDAFAGSHLPQRSQSRCYKSIGMHPKAIVSSLTSSTSSTAGKILRIVHDNGQEEIGDAKYWYCTAEVDPEPFTKDKQQPLQYYDVGKAGDVKLKAVEPAFGDDVYASHLPSIDCTLLTGLISYQKSICELDSGERCFKHVSKDREWSVSITYTKLSTISTSEVIWERKILQALILTHNRLETLPHELATFELSLQLLCASFNCFTRIPDVVFELTSLLHFNMVSNQITTIPNNIEKLSLLTSLFLGHNKLRFLPDVFGNLRNLLDVGFQHNYLSDLPPSFAELQKLKKVELSYNRFIKIPDELGDLQQLKYVHLEHNRIQHVSHSISTLLSKGVLPRLAGNPLQDPAFLMPLDSEAVKHLHTHLDASWINNKSFWPSLRVLIIGRCGSGKTSIAKAFHSQDYVTPKRAAGHDHTVGINQYFVAFKMGSELREVVLWDFAGEKEAAIINGIFMSECTLIWLAVNLEEYTDETYNRHIGCWLDSILTRICKPIVWIIGTHADKLSDREVASKRGRIKGRIVTSCTIAAKYIDEQVKDLEQQSRNCTSDLPSEASLHFNLNHFKAIQSAGPKYLNRNLQVIPLTNTHSFKGLDELKECLEKLPSTDDFQHLKNPLPPKLMEVTMSLKALSNHRWSEGKAPIAKVEEVESTIRRIVADCEQANSIRKYLEENGEIHTLPHLETREDEVVLDVPWLIDLLKYIFRHDFEHFVAKLHHDCDYFQNEISKEALRVTLEEKKTNGIIGTYLLRALWTLEGIHSNELFQSILDMLTRCGLAYKSNRSCHSEGYLFPWLLPMDPQKRSPYEYVREPGTEYNHISVRYGFPRGCKLKGLFERFIVYCRDHVPCFNRLSRSFFQASLGDIILSAMEDDGTIDLNVRSLKCAGSSTCYQDLWGVMMKLVEKLNSLLCEWKGQPIVPYVVCPRCIEVQVSDPELTSLEYIRPGPQYLIPNSQQPIRNCKATLPSAGHHKAILAREIVPPQELMLPSDPEVLPPSDIVCKELVTRAKKCCRPITEKDCLIICQRINLKRGEWQSVLEKLSWSRAETEFTLNPMPYDSPSSASELHHTILYKWIRTEGRNATVAALAKAVEITHMEHHWVRNPASCTASCTVPSAVSLHTDDL